MFGSKKKNMEETLKQQEQEIQLLRNRANELTEKLVRFQGKEEAIISALTNAQDSASKTIGDAMCKRDELIEDAKTQCEAMKLEAETTLENAKCECAQLMSRTNEESVRLLANARAEADRITSAASMEAQARISAADEAAKKTNADASKLKTDFTCMLQASVCAYKNAAKELNDRLNEIANEAATQADQLRLCCEKSNKIDSELESLNIYSNLDFDMLAKYGSSGNGCETESAEHEIYEAMDVGYGENEEGELTCASDTEQTVNNAVQPVADAVTVEEVVTAHVDEKPSSVVPPTNDDVEKVWTVDEVEKTVPAETELRSDDDLNTLLNELLHN